MLTPIGNGEYEFTFNGLTIGNFTGKITFNENSTHNPSTAGFSLEVLDRLNSNISADNLTVFYDEYGILSSFIAWMIPSNSWPSSLSSTSSTSLHLKKMK